MKLSIYCYRNLLTDSYTTPFAESLPLEAVKTSFERSCVLNPVESKKAHLDECELFLIGYFDDVTGDIEPVKPQFLTRGTQFVMAGLKRIKLEESEDAEGKNCR